MWYIETFRETGEFHKIGDQKWPKHESIFEEVGENLEAAMEVFTKRYPFGEYIITVVWNADGRSFHAEKLDSKYRNCEAVLVNQRQ